MMILFIVSCVAWIVTGILWMGHLGTDNEKTYTTAFFCCLMFFIVVKAVLSAEME